MTTTLLWLRQDLRLADQPALQAAIERGGSIIPVFIWSPEEEGEWHRRRFDGGDSTQPARAPDSKRA